MRRLRTILALVVLGLALTPVPADAYFWAWLDDWSGPRFMGTQLEWRVWCQSEQAGQNRALLLSLRRRVRTELIAYRDEKAPTTGRERHVELAIAYARIADSFLQAALYPGEGATPEEIDRYAGRALQWRTLAADHYKWAKKRAEADDAVNAPEEPPLPITSRDAQTDLLATKDLPAIQPRMLAAALPLSVAVAACDYQPLQRDRQFVNLTFGYAFDAKDSTERFEHRMLTFGASFHVVASPFLTVGSGGGVATFTSNLREPFYKIYVTPTIVDVRPGAIGRNGSTRGPWWHVVYIRYSTLVVPTGFELGSFGGQTQRYSAELTHNLGLHADLTPVIRKLQGRW